MAYTTHGHHIPNTATDSIPRARARCGGMGLCAKCSVEAGQYVNDAVPSKSEQQKMSEQERLEIKFTEALVLDSWTPEEAAHILATVKRAGVYLGFKNDTV